MTNLGATQDLSRLDLNLLRVFDQLYQHRRVAVVARVLGLSQPGVSNALARLRRALGDDLFIKTSQGMQPTPTADALAEPVSQALALLTRALTAQSAFDPATSQRRFTVAMSDIGEIYFLPRLLALLADSAPGVQLATLRDSSPQLRQDMQRGRVDLAIGYVTELHAGFYQQQLFTQRYVCLFRRDHPLAGQPMTQAAYEAAAHVTVVSAGSGHGQLQQLIDRVAGQRKILLALPHFVALPFILSSSNLVATVPEKLAQACAAPFQLVHQALPYPLPDIPIRLFWHATAHRDPGHVWLRGELVRHFQEGATPP